MRNSRQNRFSGRSGKIVGAELLGIFASPKPALFEPLIEDARVATPVGPPSWWVIEGRVVVECLGVGGGGLLTRNRWTGASGWEIDTFCPRPRRWLAMVGGGVGALRGWTSSAATPVELRHRRDRPRRQQKSLSTFICCPVCPLTRPSRRRFWRARRPLSPRPHIVFRSERFRSVRRARLNENTLI